MRQKKNLTQLNVADRLGITPQAISKWERSESMPDITLLPEISKIYDVTVEDILTAGSAGQDSDFENIMQALNTFVDRQVFKKVQYEFERADSVQELRIPMDIFMALNGQQKDILLDRLLEMEGYGAVIDDMIQYLNMTQRARLIRHVAENGDYEILEMLIPFMTRTVRTEVVMVLLNRKKFGFLEEMFLFLNHEQKDLIISYFMENNLDFDVLENFLPLFNKEQCRLITEWREYGVD